MSYVILFKIELQTKKSKKNRIYQKSFETYVQFNISVAKFSVFSIYETYNNLD